MRSLHVEEGEFPVEDLLGAHEAFLASTVREVQPVAAIDERQLETPGPSDAGGRARRSSAAGAGARSDAVDRLGADVDLDLSDEQRLIQETARDFVDNEIVPRARDNDRAARFDRELAQRLGDMGYLGAPVAEEYGGRGLDYVSYGLIVEEVGRGDSSARTVVSVQTSLVCGSIERWGTEEQKRRLAAAPVLGRGARLLRPLGARRGLGPLVDAHPGRARGRRAGGSAARRCGSRSATTPRWR